MMKAVTLKHFGSVDNFSVEEVPEPTLEEDEVLVKVKAVSINPVDTVIRSGMAFTSAFKNEDPLILGWDISGEVVRAGSKVERFREGDEVFGMVNFPSHAKGYAEFVAAPESHLARKPDNISHEEAGAATMAALTAYQALVHRAGVGEGDKILITAASGGVGHYAVQIARHFGAHVIGTSSGRNRDFVLEMGADEHVNYEEERFEDRVDDADIVLDCYGGEEHRRRSLDAVKEGGHVITLLHAPDFAREAEKRGIKGKVMGVSNSAKDMEALADLLESGEVRSNVFKSYPFTMMADAHKQVETRHTVGKVVVMFTD